MSLSLFVLYLATWALVALTPGPAVLCAMSQATRHGFRSSLAGITGTQTGNLVFFVCIALGLATLLNTASKTFTALRVAGAIYLFYLGIRIIISTFRRPGNPGPPLPSAAPVLRSLFLQGLLVQLTNPKALLFVSALVPQFIDPRRSLLLQLIILLLTTIAVDLIVLSACAFFAARGIRSFRNLRRTAWLQRVFGAALVLFGFRLLCSRR